MKQKNVFILVSLVGMALGEIGTLVTNWASDKKLDAIIDEKISERLTAHEEKEENEES